MLPSSKVVPFETEVCESRPPLWMNRTIAVGRHGCVIPEAPAREPWGVVTIVLSYCRHILLPTLPLCHVRNAGTME